MTMEGGAIPKARWVRILPGTVLIYVIAYMDRMNISLAMAGGINRDLHLSMTRSGLAAGVFFIGYMLLQVPAGHIAEHLSAKIRFVVHHFVLDLHPTESEAELRSNLASQRAA